MSYSNRLKDLKGRIKEKFGTVQYFCESADYPRDEINKIFSMKMSKLKIDDEIKRVEILLAQTPVKANPNHIGDWEREMLRSTIMCNYKSISHFLADHPSFTKSFMSNLINGRKVKNDERVQKLKSVVSGLKMKPQPFTA